MQETVTISLKHYNELRDYKSQLEKDGTIVTFGVFYTKIETREELIIALKHERDNAEDIIRKRLEPKHQKLTQKIEEQAKTIEDQKQTLSKLKKMNLFQFLRWKHSQLKTQH